MAEQSYPAFCAAMIADLEMQLPIARDGQKAEIRRAIARWRAAAKRPVAETSPEPRKRRTIPPGNWRLRTTR